MVYFESSQDLEMGDVDVGDIFLAIARRIYETLDQLQLESPIRLQNILKEVINLLQVVVKM